MSNWEYTVAEIENFRHILGEDIDTVLAAQHGSREAMEVLFMKYKPLLWRHATRYVPYMYYDDFYCELAITFIDAIAAYDVDKGIPIAGYFRSKIQFQALNLRRKIYQGMSRELSLAVMEEDDKGGPLVERLFVSDMTVEEEWCQAYEKDILHRLLAELSPQDAQIIHSYYFEDKTLDEIASEMQCSKQNVYYHKQKTLAQLLAALQGWRDDDSL